MWTVSVVLPDGGVDDYEDSRRLDGSPVDGTFAWAYRYEVDEDRNTLRVIRTGLVWRWPGWNVDVAEAEVAYYRTHQWSRVRSS